jgi:hypothetical protein
MPSRADLAATQARFYELVTGAEPVAHELAARGLDERSLAATFVGDTRLSALERLDVYANMYFFRIADALHDEFPVLAKCVGDAPFHDLITAYLLAHRPRSHSLDDVGDQLAGFVRTDALGHARPWLSELAELEWARGQVFVAEDRAPCTVAAAREAGARLLEMRLGLIPAHRLLSLAHGVETVWASGGVGEPAPAQGAVLVWRRQFEVYQRRVDPLEASALFQLAEGSSLALLCERLWGGDPPANAAAQTSAWLHQWIADELLCMGESWND